MPSRPMSGSSLGMHTNVSSLAGLPYIYCLLLVNKQKHTLQNDLWVDLSTLARLLLVCRKQQKIIHLTVTRRLI